MSGGGQPKNDQSILHSAILYRRVPPSQLKGNPLRLSSGAFSDTTDTDEMSVHLDEVLRARGMKPEDLLKRI